MASTKLHRAACASRHGIHGSKLTLKVGVAIVAILLAAQQTRNEETQCLLCQLVGSGRDTHDST